MAKYKYLRGGRVFESDKEYNLPKIGIDGKLVTPNKKIKTDPKVDPKKPPVFKTQEEHNAYYLQQLLEKNKGNSFYNKFNEYGVKTVGENPDADALLAAMGGIPAFKAPTTAYFSGANSRIKNIVSKPQPTEGYQYNKAQGVPDKESITKRKFNTGGIKKKSMFNPLQVNTPDFSQRTAVPAATMLGSGPAPTTATSTAPKQGMNFNTLLGSTAPFLDNIANLVATKKTPNIPQPVMTNAPRLATKLNINPQKRRIENDVKAAQMGIDRSTSSAGVANANKGSLLANKFRAIGDLEANKQNFEAEQGNRQAYMDFQAKSNNNQLINKRNEMQMMREDDINQRYASVVSDFGSDIANINRERNLMSRDKDALRTMLKTNPDAAYQFADTEMFKTLYEGNEPELRQLILSQKGTAQKAKLAALYKQIFNRDFTE